MCTAKPCLRVAMPRLIGHAFLLFRTCGLRDPLKAKLLELWTEVSPAAREVFDLVALKRVRQAASALLGFRFDIHSNTWTEEITHCCAS